MKCYLPLLLCCLLGAQAVFSQEKRKTEYMTVTILSDDAWPLVFSKNRPGRLRYIVTREDQTQVEDTATVPGLLQRRTCDKAYENGKLQILKKYFDQGWKLVTAATEVYAYSTNSISHVMDRYFLSKEE